MDGWLEIASKMLFTAWHSWRKWWGWRSKNGTPFALVLAMIGVTERRLTNFCLETQTMFDCFIANYWLSFVSKWFFIFIFFVFSLLKTTLANTSCHFKTVIKVSWRTVSFNPFDRVATLRLKMEAVRSRISIVKFLITLKSTIVSSSLF